MRLRRLVSLLTPPILYSLTRRMRSWVRSKAKSIRAGSTLFDGDGALFAAAVKQARVYGEYGVGKSTRWVAENTKARIMAVDTSREWVTKVSAGIPRREDHQIEWVNVGALGSWGRPLSYELSESFVDYVESIWSHGHMPDVVLVDGRWRVACFLTALLRAPVGTPIFFDDYTDRPGYHIVERYVQPSATCGRQVRFEVPRDLDRDAVQVLRDAFLYVLD